jgi:hypothetical protein
MEKLIEWALSSIVGALFGSFLAGGYLKRKGENLATHEDIDKLVDQVRAVTTATKEIEEKIDSTVWAKQRHWEMKRDALFVAVQALDRTKAAFVDLWAVNILDPPQPDGSRRYHEYIERKKTVDERWLTETNRFDETRSSVSLICGVAIRHALAEASTLIRSNASKLFKHQFTDEDFEKEADTTKQAIRKVYELARIELEIVPADE